MTGAAFQIADAPVLFGAVPSAIGLWLLAGARPTAARRGDETRGAPADRAAPNAEPNRMRASPRRSGGMPELLSGEPGSILFGDRQEKKRAEMMRLPRDAEGFERIGSVDAVCAALRGVADRAQG